MLVNSEEAEGAGRGGGLHYVTCVIQGSSLLCVFGCGHKCAPVTTSNNDVTVYSTDAAGCTLTYHRSKGLLKGNSGILRPGSASMFEYFGV